MDEFLRKFEEVLEVEPNTVTLETDFDELPWDSLAALSTMVMIQEDYEVMLSNQDLRDIDSVGQLWALVQDRQQA